MESSGESANDDDGPGPGNRAFRRREAAKKRSVVAKGRDYYDVRLRLEGRLDLVENAEWTRLQLAPLMRLKAPVSTSVFVDIADVSFIEPVALTYFVAQLDRLSQGQGVALSGNYPRSPEVLRVLVEAGFDDFMRIVRKFPAQETRSANVKLTSGEVTEKLSPKWWRPLYDFMIADGSLSLDQADELYNAFNELVENVRQHAYRRKRGNKWYGVALRANATTPGRIVVVDLGRGISRSLGKFRRNDFMVLFAEIFQAIISETSRWVQLIEGGEGLPPDLLQSLKNDEWTRVWAATQGFRNRTNGAGRGTGLFSLRRAVERSNAKALHVMAGTACVSYEEGRKPKRTCLPPLLGTAICLEVGQPRPIIAEG